MSLLAERNSDVGVKKHWNVALIGNEKKKKNHTLVNKFEKVLYPTLKLADP